ncbi:MAG: hypothetical protein JW939_05730 [Candidatus Thermoplasmatota archaeon]|nr:hypothetical protein [Candidatus Thermoplasmatota archaeon]
MARTEKKKEVSLFSDIFHAFPKLVPLILSHHPDCEPYRKDVIRIGKLRLCRGCTISYSLVLILVVSYILLPLLRGLFEPFSPVLIIGVGVVLGLFQVLRGVYRKMSIIWRSLVKVALGSGIGLILIGIFRLELGYWATFWTIMGLFIVYGLVGGALRLFYMKRTCDECEFGGNLENCPGLSIIRELDRK